ncbi:MAG: DUF4389 domain-containing protein [Chloroflexi bacterium]|nr:DUF4389 domain-containing protein [Chloroflexota bacterium]
MAINPISYPARLSIDYPDRELNRTTTFFRLFTVIPIGIILKLLITFEFVLPLVLMILFRQKYPRWWFNWNVELTKFTYRVTAYLSLMSDKYPSTDEDQYVHLELDYPDVKKDLNQWLPLVKWLLAIPHYIVLYFLGIAVMVLLIVSWFMILFTGRYSKEIFSFIAGVFRWALRVEAYAFLLVTDRYPPFSLD